MKRVAAYEALKISVNCEENDQVDMKCGGPATLGFDFFIDPDKKKLMIEFIGRCLRDNGRPCISIHDSGKSVVEKVWTKDMIERCIKKGY